MSRVRGLPLVVVNSCLAFIGGCVVPHSSSPSVVPITNTDSLSGWLPAELTTDSLEFAGLRGEVASLSDADRALHIKIRPDGSFDARIPDEVLNRFGGSNQDTLMTIAGSWSYTTDNHGTVGIQFNTTEDPGRAFLGFMHLRKGKLVMIIAIGDYDSGDLLVLHPKDH